MLNISPRCCTSLQRIFSRFFPTIKLWKLWAYNLATQARKLSALESSRLPHHSEAQKISAAYKYVVTRAKKFHSSIFRPAVVNVLKIVKSSVLKISYSLFVSFWFFFFIIKMISNCFRWVIPLNRNKCEYVDFAAFKLQIRAGVFYVSPEKLQKREENTKTDRKNWMSGSSESRVKSPHERKSIVKIFNLFLFADFSFSLFLLFSFPSRTRPSCRF